MTCRCPSLSAISSCSPASQWRMNSSPPLPIQRRTARLNCTRPSSGVSIISPRSRSSGVHPSQWVDAIRQLGVDLLGGKRPGVASGGHPVRSRPEPSPRSSRPTVPPDRAAPTVDGLVPQGHRRRAGSIANPWRKPAARATALRWPSAIVYRVKVRRGRDGRMVRRRPWCRRLGTARRAGRAAVRFWWTARSKGAGRRR